VRLPFQPTEPFIPARGLRSPHAQTVFASLARSSRVPAVVRERWETPDADFVDVDVLSGRPGAPSVLVLHGLEGSSRSGYVAAVLRGAAERGWSAFALNFRSCSGELNRLARSYHSGAIEDPAWALRTLRGRVTGPLYALGFSLGGNVLLKLLADEGDSTLLSRAVAVSVPFDLARSCAALDRDADPWAMLYRSRFLRTLKRKALLKAAAHAGSLDLARIRAVKGLRDFDDAVTAPLHGYASGADYYERCSSAPLLGQIRRSTLLISALDDPFCPFEVPPTALTNPLIQVLSTSRGGHVGFVAGSLWRPRFWAEAQALAFLETER
jgi:predicted alpha/beta-fold hydrolase